MPIPTPHQTARHIQLAGHPGRHRAQPPIQHKQRRTRHRSADRRRSRSRLQRASDRTSTVVSVGPYSLTMWPPRRSGPPVLRCRPHHHISQPAQSIGRQGSVLGRQFGVRRHVLRNQIGEFLARQRCHRWESPRAAPVSKAHHRFPTDMSKIIRSELQNPTPSRRQVARRGSTRSAMPLWVTATPLGVPVVPEV